MGAFTINGIQVLPGTIQTVDLPVSVLSDHTPVTMTVRVANGRRPGPALFLCAAVHGDEIVGVEIIRRIHRLKLLRQLRGTLVTVPIVNVFGFIGHSRYLPDRRDLNRSFPGAPKGSLSSQLAHLFRTEVMERCQYGIDFHSAAAHRINLPQIRIAPDDPQLKEMAMAFRPPIMLEAPLREKSMRSTAQELGVRVLLYEAGEALRFDEFSIRVGVRGVLGVMRHLGMLPATKFKGNGAPRVRTMMGRESLWLRAPAGGVLRSFRTVGDTVQEDEVIGIISSPLGESETEVVARAAGLVIGRTNLPVVNQGDALFHIALVKTLATADQHVELLEKELETDPMFDEDEII